MDILKKVEPYLMTNDWYVLEFVMDIINNHPDIPEDWTELLLRRAAQSKELETKIVTHLKHFPFNDKTVQLLIEGYQEAEIEKKFIYLVKLLNLDPKVVVRNKHVLQNLFDEDTWSFYDLLLEGDEQNVRAQFQLILDEMEKELYYNAALFKKSKQLAKALVDKGWMQEKEIDAIFQEELKEKFFTYKGILAVYMAGLMKLEKHIPMMASLLLRDEDVLLEQASETLLLFYSEKVVESIAAIIPKDDFPIFPIGVMGDIPTPLSMKVLKELYSQTIDGEDKAMIAKGLSMQLSHEVIPEMNDFMEKEYRQNIFDAEELAYGFFTVMGQDHPNLEKWKQKAQLRDLERKKREEQFSNIDLSLPKSDLSNVQSKSEKIGRNDPCTCGSGKKYKKCCGK